jgi:hypothetical protein
MRNTFKIQTSVQVELFESDTRESNQIFHIRPYEDNNERWSEFAIQDTDPGHFDKNPRPATKIIFDNCNLESVIEALTIYRDNLQRVNGL